MILLAGLMEAASSIDSTDVNDNAVSCKATNSASAVESVVSDWRAERQLKAQDLKYTHHPVWERPPSGLNEASPNPAS